MTRNLESDIGLSSITLPSGYTLTPAFSEKETSYFVQVESHIDSFPVQVAPINLKAKVVNKAPSSQLMVGDTVFEYNVCSEDGKESADYTVTVRKAASAIPPKLKLQTHLICSICKSFLKSPRKNLFGCNHSFCLPCLELFCESKLESSFTLWTCPLEKGKTCQQNPLLMADTSKEAELAKLECACPFESCNSTLDWQGFAIHLQSCSLAPTTTCLECLQTLKPQLANAEGKHKDTCTYNCSTCSKKISNDQKSIHDNLCNQKISEPTNPSTSDWEKDYASSNKIPFTTEKMNSLLKEGRDNLEKAFRQVEKEQGKWIPPPDVSSLMTLKGLLASSIVQNVETANSKKSLSDEKLHFMLGITICLLQKASTCFPPKLEEKKEKNDENEEAKDSFFADEVSGLLLQLGVPPSANDNVQLKAMDEEYHNCKNAGKTNEAAEIQGLIAWKMKKMKLGSGQNENQAKDLGSSLSVNQAISKFSDAIMINPNFLEASEQLLLLLLQARQFDLAFKEAQRSLSIFPIKSRIVLVSYIAASLSTSSTMDSTLIKFLDEFLNDVKLEMYRSRPPILDTILGFSYSTLVILFESLSKAYAKKGDFDLGIQVLLDALFIVPTLLQKYPSTSIAFFELCESLISFQSLLFQYSLQSKSEVYKSLGNEVYKTSIELCNRASTKTKYAANAILASIDLLCILLAKLPDLSLAVNLGTIFLRKYDTERLDDVQLLKSTQKLFENCIRAETSGTLDWNVFSNELWWTKAIKTHKDNESYSTLRKEKINAIPKASGKPSATASVVDKKAAATKIDSKAAPKGNAKIPTKDSPATNSEPKTKDAAKVETKTAPKDSLTKPEAKPALKDASKPEAKPLSTKTPAKNPPPTVPTNQSGPKPDAKPGKMAKPDNTNPDTVKAPLSIDQDTKYNSRYGLAQVYNRMLNLSKEGHLECPKSLKNDLIDLYKELIGLKSAEHDLYIELGTLYVEEGLIKEAIELYCCFPFSSTITTDDVFLHGEISRLIIKEKNYKHPKLLRSLVAEGRTYGVKSISKYTDILDQASETGLLKEVFAQSNNKTIDDVRSSSTLILTLTLARNDQLFQSKILDVDELINSHTDFSEIKFGH